MGHLTCGYRSELPIMYTFVYLCTPLYTLEGFVTKTTRGLKMSALNSLRWGDSIDGLLPCRQRRCTYVDVCRNHPYIKRWGYPAPGEPCALETMEHEGFVASAKETYSFALAWLTEEELAHIVERLSIIRLRWRRSSCRLAAEGMIRYITLDSGHVLLREPVTTRKYWPGMQRELEELNERLFTNPNAENGSPPSR